MNIKIGDSAGNSKIFTDYDVIRIPPQHVFTLENIGKELEDSTAFKKSDFERDLAKVSRQIQK